MTTMLTAAQVLRGKELLDRVRSGCNAVLLGQQELVDLSVIALCARGHLLLEGLPGLGKTELVKALGRLLGLSFRRVQFTPDLLPGDITGGPILQERGGERQLVFSPGPLFANVVLADEINRASPKTQSALLEAMQERNVTVLGQTHALPLPFFVLATQNPIELEGTYPLPEAQLDRFLFKVEVPGVSADVMTQILTSRRRGQAPALEVALTAKEIDELFAFVDGIFLPQAVANYIARLVAATHPQRSDSLAAVQKNVRFGASPRAAIAIGEAARAAALLAGRPNVDFADVQRVALPALAHRVVLQHAAVVNGITSAKLVQDLLETVPAVAKALPGAVQ
ncbi:MAG: AAA family ATPase [Planctomycetes bacterium]|jgi:MoxR-like ATPase|nr:AAA family ATPase [Planctomycetota bacterium]MCC7062308.1 AAA family ATPase [Planctomycetota bacterium]